MRRVGAAASARLGRLASIESKLNHTTGGAAFRSKVALDAKLGAWREQAAASSPVAQRDRVNRKHQDRLAERRRDVERAAAAFKLRLGSRERDELLEQARESRATREGGLVMGEAFQPATTR
jgi:hypothetical protein